jgi:serine/threonine protein phosphatase PrpC
LLKILTEASPNGGSSGPLSDEALALDSIGCTANVVIVDEERKKIFVANAGDSRAVMGKKGKAVPLSFDHKPENEVEIARIEKAGSTITEGRVDGNLNLTRAIGDLKYKQKTTLKAEEHPITSNPDVYEYEFDSDCDFVIMGCDGVWEQKTNEQMVEWVYDKLGSAPYTKDDLERVVKELLHENLSEDHTMSSKSALFAELTIIQMDWGVTT